MTKNDGGPAFPGQMPTGYDARSGNYNEGMTLRDYFASAAMSGFLAANDENFGGWAKPSQLASVCYDAADAMLAERAK